MGFLSNLRTYQGKWNVVASSKFDADEAKSVTRAEVVASNFGKSVCMYLAGGGMKFLPLSNTGKQPEVGESVNIAETNVIRLHRDGDADIYRIEVL